MGCDYANQKREYEARLEHKCAFCREPAPESDEGHFMNVMERLKKNDPVAMFAVGKKHYNGGDYARAAEYWSKAAELGDAAAHFCLGGMDYAEGFGVQKDERKAVYHWEQAAIGGHPNARAFLAIHEKDNGRLERTVKHYIIAANLGHDKSLKCLKVFFVHGIVSKDQYAAALRAHQDAVDATKSAERDKAEAIGWGTPFSSAASM